MPASIMNFFGLYCLFLIASSTTALRLPGDNFVRVPQPLFLPPASHRNVAEEVRVAASLRQSSRLPAAADSAPSRPLKLITISGQSYRQIVAELIQHCEGKRAGTSWCKPVALRVSSNATLAEAAASYDPTLGWLDMRDEGRDSVVPSSVHIFSALAPAIFVPTGSLTDVPQMLALAVRTMCDAHTPEPGSTDPVEYQLLSEFMSHLQTDPMRGRASGDSLYDPIAE